MLKFILKNKLQNLYQVLNNLEWLTVTKLFNIKTLNWQEQEQLIHLNN